MDENHDVTRKSFPLFPKCLSPLLPIFLESLKIIFLDYPRHFFTIYVVAALPLSVVLASLSISTTPRQLKSYLAHLEWLCRVVYTIQETKNVWETSQDELRKLYHFRVLHVVPLLIFSVFTLVATVTSTSWARNSKKKSPTLWNVILALKTKWIWPLLMCVVNSFVWIMWGHVLPMSTTAAGYPAAVVIVVMGIVVEVYAMAVLSLALVISVEEESAGLAVVRAGSDLMKGRRVCGWVLSGLILLGSNCIGREMAGVVDGQDMEFSGSNISHMLEMRVVYMIGLVLLLGWIVMWSNVVFTICYCDWSKRSNVNKEELNGDIELIL